MKPILTGYNLEDLPTPRPQSHAMAQASSLLAQRQA